MNGPRAIDGIVMLPIENPGTMRIAKYITMMLMTHANNPKVIMLTGSKRIFKNGRTITVSNVSTMPVAINTPVPANRTSGNTREIRYNERQVKMTVFKRDFIDSILLFYHTFGS